MGLLDIVRDVRDVAVVLRAEGDVDSSTADALMTALDAAVVEAQAHPARVLIVELDGVTYFGSAGLNALIGCAERGSAHGVAVRLVATNPEVTRPIEVTRLDSVLPPHRSVADALSSADGPQ
ncbi:anti-anti-sigma factor [Mycolicibacterium aurum]|uniref:Anti-sigma factor antagonist n=1 Tax=Mycolicibacterium aurum TaxID=1791 RepID=A0A3S5EJ60_MYCAU|nr:STAS domain-containing protein [Mycolicibacterium aurum]VEG53045.1 anti-anti-sigma factor [Mycolicibacterium aurum]